MRLKTTSLSSACLACALYGGNPGCESVRRVTLSAGSGRQRVSRPLSATFRPEVSFIIRGGGNPAMIVKGIVRWVKHLTPTRPALNFLLRGNRNGFCRVRHDAIIGFPGKPDGRFPAMST